MSFLRSWLCKQNGDQCDWASAVNELGGPVIPGTLTADKSGQSPCVHTAK